MLNRYSGVSFLMSVGANASSGQPMTGGGKTWGEGGGAAHSEFLQAGFLPLALVSFGAVFKAQSSV